MLMEVYTIIEFVFKASCLFLIVLASTIIILVNTIIVLASTIIGVENN